jgi:hypothetical protein
MLWDYRVVSGAFWIPYAFVVFGEVIGRVCFE